MLLVYADNEVPVYSYKILKTRINWLVVSTTFSRNIYIWLGGFMNIYLWLWEPNNI